MKLTKNKGTIVTGTIFAMALISLVAMPNLAGIRQRSGVSADKRTAEQIGKAVRIWVTDVDEEPRELPRTIVEYDELEGLTGIYDGYIGSGYTANSLNKGTGHYYVSSIGDEDEIWNRSIIVGIAESADDLSLEKTTVNYDGSKAAWAYKEM